MTGLLAANGLMLALGLGLLPLLGAARSPRELAVRAGLGWLLGLTVTGIAAATLALVHVAVGLPMLAVGAAASLAAGLPRLRGAGVAPPRWTRGERLLAAGSVATLAVLLVHAWQSFRVTPVVKYDGWAMWTMKARALVDLGWADPQLFAGDAYRALHLDYPLFLPALHAVGIRAAGVFDPRLVVLQCLLLGVAGVWALGGLLAGRVPPLMLWPSLLAVATAPTLLGQLETAYADAPLAVLVAASAAAGVRWLLDGTGWTLSVAALLLAGAALTKSEGLLYAVALLAALALPLVRRDRARLRPLGLAALAVALALLPWRVYMAVNDLHSDDSLQRSFDLGWVGGRAGRGPIALQSLLEEAFDPRRWALLLPLALLAAGFAAWRGDRRGAAFLGAFAALIFGALSWIYLTSPLSIGDYLSSSADRVVSALVLGCAAAAPLVAATSSASGRARDRASGPS